MSLPESAIARIDALLAKQERVLLGIAAPPGAGKSTIAEWIHQHYLELSVVVPMDGYHLANVELARLGRADRKGAQDTFDSAGFVSLLSRIRHQQSDEIVYAPEFRREIEEPIANAIPVLSDKRLIIIEGNYLLLELGFWQQVTGLLDDTWYVEVDQALRLTRLINRHIQFGRSPEAAAAWVENTDEPNARQIEASKHRAQFVLAV
ncbi:nucleoside/nucleotide kinase family protein [Leeia sp. TBRC 13508]|uniref:Nucleoside/nucleotide kinase family protein n=1 Tax=Leeia speluncae TaxID=2884804 RepID=A0ABS8DAF0_9NEIS|nr:nucleoside/nucleotide kinase family protein [Leeia speluncae]MCB6185185.1 nucleoside/nucleotide kinase family protein [Leeia speluncae]